MVKDFSAYAPMQTPMLELAYQQRAAYASANPTSVEAAEAVSLTTAQGWYNYLITTRFEMAYVQAVGDAAVLLAKKDIATDYLPVDYKRYYFAGQLKPIPVGGQYEDSELKQLPGPRVGLSKYGRLFGIPLEVYEGNRLNDFADIPAGWGREAGWLRETRIVQASIMNNPLMYDGINMFDASRSNVMTTALTRDLLGAQAIQVAVGKSRGMLGDDGRRLRFQRWFMIVPTDIMDEDVDYLITADKVVNPANGFLVDNPAKGYDITPVVVPSLSDPNDWALIPHPDDHAIVLARYRNGVETPQIFQLNGAAVTDQYSASTDMMYYKCRYEFEAYPVSWRGAVKSIVP